MLASNTWCTNEHEGVEKSNVLVPVKGTVTTWLKVGAALAGTDSATLTEPKRRATAIATMILRIARPPL